MAFAIVFVAFGTELSASHATGSSSLCSSLRSVTVSENIGMTQDHTAIVKKLNAFLNRSEQDNASKKASEVSKTSCCSSYCSPAFTLSNQNLGERLPLIDDNWPLSAQSITPAEPVCLKRPPRVFPFLFMRA